MPLARIITNHPEDARDLFRRLEAYGYTIEIVPPGTAQNGPAALEIELERLETREALAKAARLSQGKQVNVLVGPDCVEPQHSEPERVSLSERLIETAEQVWRDQPLVVSQEKIQQLEEIEPRRKRVAEIACVVRQHLKNLALSSERMLQHLRMRAMQSAARARKELATNLTFLEGKWEALRERLALAAERRQEARQEHVKQAELHRSRRLLQEQEELQRKLAYQRHAEEERERHQQLQEQLRQLEQAQERERRQRQHEAQLERQRLEALRLAEERERLVRERAEREQAAAQARRLHAEGAARRRQEREQEALLARMESAQAKTENPSIPSVQESAVEPVLSAATTNGPVADDRVASEVRRVPVAPTAGERSKTRWETDLNPPYHPGWTWAAATAGAVTVGVMLLWTAAGSRHGSGVQFAPLSPSSLLPPRASQIQQQVPFGPVKVTVQKAGPAPAAVPVIAPAVASPDKIPGATPASTRALPKPAAARSRVVTSGEPSSEGAEPEVVVRHFTLAPKRVPQAGQTATIKRYSDLN
jgi:hypothetical protein